jgi:hypothetical protein
MFQMPEINCCVLNAGEYCNKDIKCSVKIVVVVVVTIIKF